MWVKTTSKGLLMMIPILNLLPVSHRIQVKVSSTQQQHIHHHALYAATRSTQLSYASQNSPCALILHLQCALFVVYCARATKNSFSGNHVGITLPLYPFMDCELGGLWYTTQVKLLLINSTLKSHWFSSFIWQNMSLVLLHKRRNEFDNSLSNVVII